jgi:hypothetical protein
MALAVGRKADQVRVLSDLSGRVVGAMIDDSAGGSEGDAFMDALRRYREDGAPAIGLWRGVAAGIATEGRAAQVLRHLTRDLLKGVSVVIRDDEPETEPSEPAPVNVRPIDAPRDVPALEQGSDGTWKPSGAALASQQEVDANTLRRSVPSVRSRYPQVAVADRVVLPPAPKRFTETTAPAPTQKVMTPPPPTTAVAPPVPSATAAPLAAAPGQTTALEAPVVEAAAPSAPPVEPAPAVEATPISETAAPLQPRESVIKQVATGIEVVAGPFARFQQLAMFVKALRALPGVQDVTTRQFVRGMVHLRVRHSHATELADRLLALTDFSPEVVSSTQDRIELKVDIAE